MGCFLGLLSYSQSGIMQATSCEASEPRSWRIAILELHHHRGWWMTFVAGQYCVSNVQA
jgi:hypothetical protein